MVLRLSDAYVKMINAFRNDCYDLLHKFKLKESADFRDFVPLWKELKFNLIYEKYAKDGLQYDFKQDTLQLATLLMLNENFVGGLYLLYGLYYIQNDPKPSIRLNQDDFSKILSMVRIKRKTPLESCQPGYLIAKLLKNNAFAFVCFSREYSLEGLNRSRLIFENQGVQIKEENQREPSEWFEEFCAKTNEREHFKKIDEEYLKKKQALKQEHPELNLSLDMVPEDLIEDMKNSLSQTNTLLEDVPLSIGSRRQHLKNRKVVTKIRHSKSGPSQPTESTSKEPSKKISTKEMGRRRGKCKHYLMEIMNEPQQEYESFENDDETNEPILNLPDIG